MVLVGPGHRDAAGRRPLRAPDAAPLGAGYLGRSLDTDEYARIAAVEDDHWWYRSTRALVADLLTPWLGRGQRGLDAGCGPGGNGAWLAQHGTVVGTDIAADALRFVRDNRTETLPVQADLQALPLAGSSFDHVIAITVLYTVEDDERGMSELARVLRPGGAAVFVEPAFESLRRAHDATVHSRRRYRRGQLAGLAARAGLRPRRVTYAYSFLTPPAAALSLADRVRPATTEGSASDVDRRALDAAFAPMARVERRLLARHDIPVGTSAIVLATRD
jgi:SAM-dependent methyltransferase